MRFLVGADVPPDPNSGAAGTVYWTNQALRELGHAVDEIWQDDLPHRITHGNLHYLLELPRAYRDAVRLRCTQADYDVIMLSQPHAWLAAKDHKVSKRPGVFLNRSHGVENMVDDVMHSWSRVFGVRRTSWGKQIPSVLLNRLLRRHFPMLCQYADGIVVGASDNADYIMKHFRVSQERVKVATHGVNPEFLERPLARECVDRFRRIMYVGQFAFVKAPHIVASVFSHLAASHPDVRLTWVCAKEHHASGRAMLDPAVQSRVQFLDWRSQQELIELYDSHGIFLFPSFFEGCGKAPLEAMARGCSVVASRVGGMADTIKDHDNGLLVDAGQTELFMSSVGWLLENPHTARSLGMQARETVLSASWKNVAQDIADFAVALTDSK